ncbi:hypothetical protein ABZT08_23645 [Streptomyces sp. NPDC005526]|uniref:hypothetical protein n=1 Tax=Streptomyces sp. NPDC005526 TaxID=3156885 RepID=UPI0033AD59A9
MLSEAIRTVRRHMVPVATTAVLATAAGLAGATPAEAVQNAEGGATRLTRTWVGYNTARDHGGGINVNSGSLTLTRRGSNATPRRAARAAGRHLPRRRQRGPAAVRRARQHPDNCAPADTVPGCVG